MGRKIHASQQVTRTVGSCDGHDSHRAKTQEMAHKRFSPLNINLEINNERQDCKTGTVWKGGG
jgi:hypothetical protein